MLALDGVRILDLTRLLPGGVCTMLLADMGADVIKVEDPQGGDYARWMPPLLDGLGAFFRASNRNKRSIILNLKDERGQAVLHRLIENADVLIEGNRPGVTARLKCDYATLKAINPRLIYCSLSGWGQTGPYYDLSGHDLNYTSVYGMQGSMKIAQPAGGQVADVGGAYVGVMGITAALYQREKTGEGAYIDVALSESALPFVMYQFVESVTTGLTGGRGVLTGGMAFYNVYASSDGTGMALAAIEPKFWQNFCNAVSHTEWIALHQDYSAQETLKLEIVAMFAAKTAAEWNALLHDADCCFTVVQPPQKLADDPQLRARDMAGIGADGVPWMRSPVLIGDARIALGKAPEYGEHTRQVLGEAGYSAGDIAELESAGVVK